MTPPRTPDATPRLREVFPQQLSAIVHRHFITATAPSVLVVSASGEYRRGSLGNPDARAMRAEILRGIGAYSPLAVVLDWRELDYAWGDGLLMVLADVGSVLLDDYANDPHRDLLPPLNIVTSSRCRPALFSLLGLSPDQPPAWHFSDLGPAVAASQAAVTRWLDAD